MALCNQPKAFTSDLSDDQSRYLSRNGWATAKNLLNSTLCRRLLKLLTDDASTVESTEADQRHAVVVYWLCRSDEADEITMTSLADVMTSVTASRMCR